jgi:hypothetical protein
VEKVFGPGDDIRGIVEYIRQWHASHSR